MLLMIITTNGIFLITSVSLAIGLGGLAWASFGVNHLDVGGGVCLCSIQIIYLLIQF